jgi:hypothetical protein
MSLRYDGSDVKPNVFYAIEGSTLKSLLEIAQEMSSGVRMDADRRRDAAQWMQERLIQAVAFDLDGPQ